MSKTKKTSKLPKYPDGGKPLSSVTIKGKKLFVTNPNDPRLKAYQDSLFLYNNYLRDLQDRALGADSKLADLENSWNPNDPMISNLRKYWAGKIQPLSVEQYSGGYNGMGTAFIPKYKKPTQPVFFRNPSLPAKQVEAKLSIPNPVKKDSKIKLTGEGNAATVSGINYGYYDSRRKNKDWGTLTDEQGNKINLTYDELDKMSDNEIKDFFSSFKNQEFYGDRFIDERNRRLPQKSYGGYNPAISDYEKMQLYGNAASSTTTSVGSAINPVVGGIMGLGQGIGNNLRQNKFEKVDEYGNVNQNKVIQGAVIGSFFDPIKALSTRLSYKGGLLDFSGKGYAKIVADKAKAEYNAKQYELLKPNKLADLEVASQFPTYGVNQSYFAKGGEIKDNRPADLNFGRLHLNSSFTPKKINLAKNGVAGTWKIPKAVKFGNYALGADAIFSILDILNQQSIINNSRDPEQTKRLIEAERQVEYNKLIHPDNRNYPKENLYLQNGGKVSPEYEAENGEVVKHAPMQFPQVFNGGYINPSSSTTSEINGATHEQGGVEMAGGEKIFSDKLKPKGMNKTYADIAKLLGKKKGKYEKLGNDAISQNTKKLGVNLIDKQLDELFEKQESGKMAKMNSKGLPKAVNGLRNGWPPYNYNEYNGHFLQNDYYNPNEYEDKLKYKENLISLLRRNSGLNLTEFYDVHPRSDLIKQFSSPTKKKESVPILENRINNTTSVTPITPVNPYNPSQDLLNESVIKYKKDADKQIKNAEKFMNKEAKKIIPNKQFKNTQVGGFLSNPNVQTGIGQGAAMLGDYINQISAINKMKSPNQAALAPKVKLDKNMDTSSYKREALKALRTGQKQAGMTGNSNVANAVRGDLLSRYLDAMGNINTESNNYKMQAGNQEAGINAQIAAQNAGILNDLYAAQNQFWNNRIGARQRALSGLFANSQLMAKDYRDMNFEKNVKLPLINKGFSNQTVNYAGMEELLKKYLNR